MALPPAPPSAEGTPRDWARGVVQEYLTPLHETTLRLGGELDPGEVTLWIGHPRRDLDSPADWLVDLAFVPGQRLMGRRENAANWIRIAAIQLGIRVRRVPATAASPRKVVRHVVHRCAKKYRLGAHAREDLKQVAATAIALTIVPPDVQDVEAYWATVAYHAAIKAARQYVDGPVPPTRWGVTKGAKASQAIRFEDATEALAALDTAHRSTEHHIDLLFARREIQRIVVHTTPHMDCVLRVLLWGQSAREVAMAHGIPPRTLQGAVERTRAALRESELLRKLWRDT